jgi:MFS transporter, VNT family, synaptic vesicle glycoprotein 2
MSISSTHGTIQGRAVLHSTHTDFDFDDDNDGDGDFDANSSSHESEGDTHIANVMVVEESVETALTLCGCGRFQFLMLLLCGAANAADAIEILSISFVLPRAEKDLNLSSQSKGWLTAMIFVGMMFGSWSWGGAADKYGRKLCLGAALAVNGLSALISAFMPTFATILLFRFLSGFGVGGSIPIVFAYFAEIVPAKHRSDYLVYLAMFWMLGSLFTAGMAWFIIPQTVHITMPGVAGSFSSWRLFLAICSIPSILIVFGLRWCPESPKFLASQKRMEHTADVLFTIARSNSARMPDGLAVTRTDIVHVLTSLSGSGDNVSDYSSTANSDVMYTDTDDIPAHSSHYQQQQQQQQQQEAYPLDDDPLLTSSVNLVSSSDESEQRSLLHNDSEFVLRESVDTDDSLCARFRFYFRVFSRQYGYRRPALLLSFIWFMLSFGLYGMSLWAPQYFDKQLDHVSIYLTAFLDAASQLPGSIASLFLVRHFSPATTLALNMLLSAVTIFFYLVVSTDTAIVAVSCVFAMVSIGGWNALNILSTQYFPASIRSTAYGIFAACGRIGAISGNLMFGQTLGLSPSIPIVIVSVCLLLGGIATLFLPRHTVPTNKLYRR